VRNAERLADATRIVDILAGAAGAGAVDGSAMVVELQRNTENVIALALEKASHNGAVDAAGHGDDNACIFRLLVKIQCVHGVLPILKRTLIRLPCAGPADFHLCRRDRPQALSMATI
jgi:hypothetical protein